MILTVGKIVYDFVPLKVLRWIVSSRKENEVMVSHSHTFWGDTKSELSAVNVATPLDETATYFFLDSF